MDKEIDYKLYQEYLGKTPKFFNKYLELNILKRLKDISLLCGMDYASKYAYDFYLYVSRYDHSLNAAKIVYNLTKDRVMALATLFHDVSSPTFSHVVDFMNGDFIKQESTEEKTAEILYNSKELRKCLEIDGIDIEDVINFKDYTVVDMERPYMCADRIENIISVGMAWVNELDFDKAKYILDSMYIVINEFGDEEIAFNNESVAILVKDINDKINKLTHTSIDNYMMMLMADILRRCIDLKILSYDDLFRYGEHQVMDIIDSNLGYDTLLDELWIKFLTIKEFPNMKKLEIKNKVVNPLVNKNRLIV